MCLYVFVDRTLTLAESESPESFMMTHGQIILMTHSQMIRWLAIGRVKFSKSIKPQTELNFLIDANNIQR